MTTQAKPQNTQDTKTTEVVSTAPAKQAGLGLSNKAHEIMKAPLDVLSELCGADGELTFLGETMFKRIKQFQAVVEKTEANLPLWETCIFQNVPAGTKVIPVPVFPKPSDAWTAETTRIKYRDGEVEPSADFLLRLANTMGVKLVQTFAGIVEGPPPMYSVRYNATLLLPSGQVLAVENEGKDVSPYNNDGTLQAHVVEATRKKAKRNAIKALLGLPTTMPAAEFNRPWIVLRPEFTPGVSAETDALIEIQKQLIAQSQRLLLAGSPDEVSAAAIDDLKSLVESADTLDALKTVGKSFAQARLTTAERAELEIAYRARKTLLETGEVVG